MKQLIFTILGLCILTYDLSAQQSVARQWNEVLLDAIRVDVSRPTVHARNLCHVSSAMYDAWAAYDDVAGTFFLGNQIGDYNCQFDGIDIPADSNDRRAAQEEAISYAAYRILISRFVNSPGADVALPMFDSLMSELGYDTQITSTDYSTNDPAALGNYIALSCLEFGLLDHSNEEMNYAYADTFYQVVNPPLQPELPGNPNIVDLNHWQPLAIGGNPARKFLNPHWSYVTAFSLTEDDVVRYEKDGIEYPVYHDPGVPPRIDYSDSLSGLEDFYKWNHALVAVWSGQLDASDGVMVDISPASIGNLTELPTTEEEFRAFYNLLDGGVADTGYAINPATGLPYEPQIVPLGDFGRVLAEFWADGPNSETPPGHWFTILNAVSDHPDLEKRFEGSGEVLNDLEWDIKSYFALAGAMHDVAVAVWGVKSYYDFIRPISAIRAMSDLGQSSDSSLMSYHPGGIPLVDEHIELVLPGDELEGDSAQHVGKIKIYAWRGPDHIGNPDSSSAGAGWILADNWWPYQKPSFITPPFAGFVSGHSTFSRAAAEVLTLFTGDEYFPGGIGIFDAPKNEFLQFENGPSVDIELQWAKYRDASDQASLSRLWGGIHPPIDDVPGRKMGMKIGPEAFDKAKFFFEGGFSSIANPEYVVSRPLIRNYPNPARQTVFFEYSVHNKSDVEIAIYDLNGRMVSRIPLGQLDPGVYTTPWSVSASGLPAGQYFYRLESENEVSDAGKLVIQNR